MVSPLLLLKTAAILFTNLARAVSLDVLVEWWLLPVSVLLNMLVGVAIGTLVCRILRLGYLSRIVTAMLSIGNYGNLPLAIVVSICSTPGNTFSDEPLCQERGIAYVALGMSVGEICVWTIVYDMLSSSSGTVLSTTTTTKRASSSSSYVEMEDDEDEENCNGGQEAVVAGGDSNVRKENSSGAGGADSADGGDVVAVAVVGTAGVGVEKAVVVKRRAAVLQRLSRVMTPPFISVVVSLMVGLIPPVKDAFFGVTGVLQPLTAAITTISKGLIPVITIILGSNMSDGPTASALTPLTIGVIVSCRLVILPVIGGSTILLLLRYAPGVAPLASGGDNLFVLALLLPHAVPTAVNIGTLATMQGRGQKETSVVLFWMYVCSVPMLTVWLMCIVYFVSE